MTVATPMITPSIVRADRILFRPNVPSAVRSAESQGAAAMKRCRFSPTPATEESNHVASAFRSRSSETAGAVLAAVAVGGAASWPPDTDNPEPSRSGVVQAARLRCSVSDAGTGVPFACHAEVKWRSCTFGVQLSSRFDPPIADRDDATGIGCHVCIVRDENDRDALAIEFLKHAEDFDARMRIEIARGLVGEHQRGVIDQGPGDGHALLLAARHLRRLVAGAIREPDAVPTASWRSLSRLPPAWPARGVIQGHDHVLRGGGRGRRLKLWKTNPTLPARTRAR